MVMGCSGFEKVVRPPEPGCQTLVADDRSLWEVVGNRLHDRVAIQGRGGRQLGTIAASHGDRAIVTTEQLRHLLHGRYRVLVRVGKDGRRTTWRSEFDGLI